MSSDPFDGGCEAETYGSSLIENYLTVSESLRKLCVYTPVPIFTISPAKMVCSYIVRSTSFGASDPIFTKFLSNKYFFTSLIGFCFRIPCSRLILRRVALFLIKTEILPFFFPSLKVVFLTRFFF